MSDPVDTTGCLTKAQAAQALGVSTKGVERAVQAGDLVQHWRRQPGTPDVAVYFPDEVAALATKRAQERRRGPSGGVLVPGPAVGSPNGNGHRANLHSPDATSALTPMRTGSDPDPLRAFAVAVVAAVMSQTSETRPAPMSQTLYVTVPEAAAILGFPHADVRRLIQTGDLPHRRTGRGGIRIRRKDLEAL